MTLNEFNKAYEYQKDIHKFKRVEHWEVIKPDKEGKYRGDCEDYCLTVKDSIPEYKDWELWYCKIAGSGHCVLVKHNKVLDCILKEPTTIIHYRQILKATDMKKFNCFVVFSKKLVAKLRRAWWKMSSRG